MLSGRLRIGNAIRLLAAASLSWSCLLTAAAGADESTAKESAEANDFFEKRIRPLLVDHCFECHTSDAGVAEGGLRLDTREGLRKGGDSGPAIVPGDPEKSLLIKAVRHADKSLQMPPNRKLTAMQIADLEQWVRKGAADPRKAAPRQSGMSLEAGRAFWSFQPVTDPPIPAVRDAAWPKNDLDRFVLAKLEAAGLAPAASADRRTLLRRVTFDLTGLPPTPAELESFLADKSPRAFEAVVDRLLSSPRYGERWGRHWLDVVRYADTCGNASDYPVPQARRYRDWVIAAFQRDLPYDQFLREQIAGDLLPSATDAERIDRTVATGYLAIARRFGGDRRGEHHLTLEDTIDNLGRALLGCTISCARCHDHKFDPFTMKDYYGLYGIFSSTRYPFPGAEVGKRQEDFVPLMTPAQIDAFLKPHREKLQAVQAEVKTLEAADAEAKKTEGADKQQRIEAAGKALAEGRAKLAAVQAEAPLIETAYAVAEGSPADARIQLRGDPKRLGDETSRRFPEVLGGQSLPEKADFSGRLQLADWIASEKNPLTARVMVNRLWHFHFGRGIVQTPNDFGVRGQLPTHPELLDHLASRFIESGWSVKAMHRMILLSQTWRLSSSDVEENHRLDPNNELFRRFARRRLDAESIRDAMLFVSGELDESPSAAHPFPPQNTWGWTQHNPFVANYETKRRSVYLMQQRLRRNPYLALFDGADPSSSTGVRLLSTTPLQALFMMNDPLAHASAEKLAARILSSAKDDAVRLEFAWMTAWSRPPEPEERAASIEFLKRYQATLQELKSPANDLERNAWAALSRSLLAANEFIYID